MVTTILFDLDDTLLDRGSTVAHYVKALHQRYQLQDVPLETFLGRFRELDQHGYAERHAVFSTLIAEFRLPTSAEEMAQDFRYNAWGNCVLLPDAKDVLDAFRARGNKLGIITNGSRESQRSKLVESGLDKAVDVALVSGEEDIWKPSAEIFQRAVERLGVRPSECVFVGDNPATDIVGAHGVGMITVWIRGYRPWPQDIPIVPKHTITQLSELLSIRF